MFPYKLQNMLLPFYHKHHITSTLYLLKIIITLSTVSQNLLNIYTKTHFPLQIVTILRLRTERGDQFVSTKKYLKKL